ncbi:MAG: DUF120 domain-containing protein [Candidatus Nanohalobium sp.]
MKLEGKVISGKGEAQKFLSMKPYEDKIEEKAGFRPFPGTLNLKVTPEKLEEFKQRKEARKIEGFEYEGDDYGGLELYEAEIEGLEVALLDIERADHGEDVAEVVAPVKLREKLDIVDGDRVEIDG